MTRDAQSFNKIGREILYHRIGLRQVLSPDENLLKAGDKCYNVKLAHTLRRIAHKGPQAFYNGVVGRQFVKDVRKADRIIIMKDLRSYKVDVTDEVSVDVMGFRIGLLGLSLVVNILNRYGSLEFMNSSSGLHRLINAMKHMFAIRMNLGDLKFVNTTKYEDDMLSPSFAAELCQKIHDNTTFPAN